VNTHKPVTICKSPKQLNSDRASDSSENSIDRNFMNNQENKIPPRNKYLDKQYSVIISKNSSYTCSSQKEKLSMENHRSYKKQSFITDSKGSSDYFKDYSMSIKDSVKSNEKVNKFIDEVKNKYKEESRQKSEVSKHINCRSNNKSHNKNKNEKILKMLEF